MGASASIFNVNRRSRWGESACEGETGTRGLDACTVGRQQACTTFTRTLPTRGRRYTPTPISAGGSLCIYARTYTRARTPSCTLKLRKIIVHREGGERGMSVRLRSRKCRVHAKLHTVSVYRGEINPQYESRPNSRPRSSLPFVPPLWSIRQP